MMRTQGRIRPVQTLSSTFSVFEASLVLERRWWQSVLIAFPRWKGDGCMKDTDHPIRHPRVHLAFEQLPEGEPGEDCRNYPLHFQNCHFFTRHSANAISSQAFAKRSFAKVTAQKRSSRAGASPLFCGRSAQKFSGVALTLGGTSRRRFA